MTTLNSRDFDTKRVVGGGEGWSAGFGKRWLIMLAKLLQFCNGGGSVRFVGCCAARPRLHRSRFCSSPRSAAARGNSYYRRRRRDDMPPIITENRTPTPSAYSPYECVSRRRKHAYTRTRAGSMRCLQHVRTHL